MNIHEYQGKEIFRAMGVAVPEGRVAFTAEEAVEKAKIKFRCLCSESTNSRWG